jgi:hypothetical protein
MSASDIGDSIDPGLAHALELVLAALLELDAELAYAVCRADEVGGEHGREHAVRLRRGTDARDELLDLVDDAVA